MKPAQLIKTKSNKQLVLCISYTYFSNPSRITLYELLLHRLQSYSYDKYKYNIFMDKLVPTNSKLLNFVHSRSNTIHTLIL